MMKEPNHFTLSLTIGLLLLLIINGCGTKKTNMQVYFAAPVLLPDTRPEMNAPGFWISLHPEPNKVIMSPGEIQLFNRYIRDKLGSVKDLTQYSPIVSRARVNDRIINQLRIIKKKGYYDSEGKKALPDFFKSIEDYINLDQIPPKVTVQFGLVAAWADQRIIPTARELYTEKMNLEFDRLQNSALDVGTPLAILHGTRDGKWVWAVSPLSSGWIKAEKVAICSRNDLAGYIKASSFIVVTNAKADIFFDRSLTDFHARARMGTRFPRGTDDSSNVVEILFPYREANGACTFIPAFVQRQDVHQGFLPYAPRNVISQAFKLLHAPYGWGGMFGEQDCSRFIQEVFAAMGIMFPRNSTRQANVGTLIAFFDKKYTDSDKIAVLANKATCTPTTLWIKGHIMLFLGFVDGYPYAIHATWGYPQPHLTGERVRVTKRTVVSSLRLGEGSSTGSLLKRLNAARVVDMNFPGRK